MGATCKLLANLANEEEIRTNGRLATACHSLSTLVGPAVASVTVVPWPFSSCT